MFQIGRRFVNRRAEFSRFRVRMAFAVLRRHHKMMARARETAIKKYSATSRANIHLLFFLRFSICDFLKCGKGTPQHQRERYANRNDWGAFCFLKQVDYFLPLA